MASDPTILAEMYGLVRNRGLVVNYGKDGIEQSFQRPVFPRSQQEMADLLLSLPRRDTWPGLHVTSAEYRSPPKAFGELGDRQAVHFFLDLDGRVGLGPTRPVASAMAHTLDDLGVPHWVSYSGRSGFHLHIPASAFPDRIDGVPFPVVAPRVFTGVKHVLIRSALEMCPRDLAGCIIHPKWYYPTTQGIQRLPFSRHESTGQISVPVPDDSIRRYDPHSPETSELGLEALSSILDVAPGSAEILISLAEAETQLPRPPHHTR